MWQYIQASSLTTSFVKFCLGSGWWPYYLVVTKISLSVSFLPWAWYCQQLRGLLGGFRCSCIWFLVQGRTSNLHSSRWISSFKAVFCPKSFQWRCSLLETSCAEVQQQLLKKMVCENKTISGIQKAIEKPSCINLLRNAVWYNSIHAVEDCN